MDLAEWAAATIVMTDLQTRILREFDTGRYGAQAQTAQTVARDFGVTESRARGSMDKLVSCGLLRSEMRGRRRYWCRTTRTVAPYPIKPAMEVDDGEAT